jgi:short-subunit dehydrogenase
VVVITGASSGVGRAAAAAFAAHGCDVVLAARGEPALAEVAALVEAAGARALVAPTDVADAADVERLAAAAVARFGRIDVWVSAAAVVVAGRLGDEDPAELRRLVETNVLGNLLSSRAALTVFRDQGHGTLIDVASLLGLVPNPVVPAYVMSKFAVRGLSLSLRQLVRRDRDIHVCVVVPGPVDTPLFQRAANHTGRQLRAIPPAAAPERVAAAIVSCARRPRRQVTAGVVPHATLVAHRLAPRATEWVVATVSAATVVRHRLPAPATPGSLFDPPPAGSVHGGWRRGRRRRRLGERVGWAQAVRGAQGDRSHPPRDGPELLPTAAPAPVALDGQAAADRCAATTAPARGASIRTSPVAGGGSST